MEEYNKNEISEKEFLKENPILKKLKNREIVFYLISFLVGFSGFIIISTFASEEMKLELLISIFTILTTFIVFLFFAINTTIKKKNYLALIIEKRIKEKYPEYTYVRKKGINEDVIERMGYFRHYFIYKTEDYLKGIINGVSFESSDVRFKRSKRIISGRIFVFDYNKKTTGRVFITEKYFFHPLPFDLKKLKLESAKFCEMFNVYADEKFDAFLCLTPEFMESLLKIEERYEGLFCFLIDDNKIYVAIENDIDTFNPGNLEFLSIKHIDDMIDEAMIFSDLIKQLNLE